MSIASSDYNNGCIVDSISSMKARKITILPLLLECSNKNTCEFKKRNILKKTSDLGTSCSALTLKRQIWVLGREPKCNGVVFIEFYKHHMLKVYYKLRLLYVDTSDLYFLRKLFIDFNTRVDS